MEHERVFRRVLGIGTSASGGVMCQKEHCQPVLNRATGRNTLRAAVLDPLIALASTIHSSPGVYAVLLGSGVSRAAQIQTGWEVTLDLVNRVAELECTDTAGDPASWYAERFGGDPNYSVLLQELAGTTAERTDLLASYFEPSDDEREQGIKTPAKAHHAIARLVKGGFVRVVITTNFDRLVEHALQQAGINPSVLHTSDQDQGAAPLAHTECTVIKVHGDYRDQQLKNTAEELEEYDEHLNRLLDQVFDEYGLIVCGWSADWDTALVGAIDRATSRRYSTYWAAQREPGDVAAGLIQRRGARVVTITDAESLFTQLAEKVESLVRMGAAHPLGPALAVEAVKRYIQDGRSIDLRDLMHRETERVFGALGEAQRGLYVEHDHYMSHLEHLGAMSTTVVHMLAAGAYFGESTQRSEWVRVVGRLLNHPHRFATHPLADVDRYPALLAFYSAGIAAVAASNEALVYELVNEVKYRPPSGSLLAVHESLLYPYVIREDWFRALFVSEAGESYRWPESEWLYRALRKPLQDLLPDDEEYSEMFDRFEYLLALLRVDMSRRDEDGAATDLPTPKPGTVELLPPIPVLGRFVDKGEPSPPSRWVTRNIEEQGDEWSLLRAGAFGGAHEPLEETLQHVETHVHARRASRLWGG